MEIATETSTQALACPAPSRDRSTLSATRQEILRRYRQTRSLLQRGGTGELLRSVRTKLAEVIAINDFSMPVRESDVLEADLALPVEPRNLAYDGHATMSINWVMTPPARGSGGHTTIFRIINWMQAQGHDNRVYFYDKDCSDHGYFEAIVNDYYGFRGPVGNVDDGMADAHASFATGWPTAYAVFNSPSAGFRCYFVQDFEPSFHATSSSSVLAENTYRMGFHGITAGKWLAQKLRHDYGMAADHFDFGCDLQSYRLQSDSPRNGIAFYVRAGASRRASELGLMAIELFARRRPDIEIHLYGDKVGPRDFRFIDHGHVTPAALNSIYNRCYAGLSLSLTNVSLVPHEMLACGCIPVVNDAEQNRIVLDNPFVRYVPLTPHRLCSELEAVVGTENWSEMSRRAAESARSASWDDAGRAVEDALIRLLSRADS